MKKLLSTALSLTLLLTLFTFNTYAANYDFDDPGIVENDYTTYPVLRRGDTGEVVEQLQVFINWYRHPDSIDVDGSFGSITETYLKKVQEQLDVDADGIAGPKTWKALFKNCW